LKCALIAIELHIVSNSLLQQFVSATIFTWKTFYGRGLKSVTCVALLRNAADDIRITIFFKSFGEMKINELIVTNNKLRNHFAILVRSGLGPNVGRGPPVLPRSFKEILKECSDNSSPFSYHYE
jgi:hypothetical protein